MIRRMTGAAGAVALVAVSLPAFAQPVPAQKYPYRSGPVTITSCTVNENASNSTVSPNSLRINYYNNRAQNLTSITFRVRYAQTPVTITDTGTFAPKQSVTHQFNQLGGLPWTGPDASMCRVLTATFADGRVVNPKYAGADPGAMTPPDGSAPMSGDTDTASPSSPAPADMSSPDADASPAPQPAPTAS